MLSKAGKDTVATTRGRETVRIDYGRTAEKEHKALRANDRLWPMGLGPE
jgi:hypothetical protein